MFIFCTESEFDNHVLFPKGGIEIIINSSFKTERDLIDYYARAINSPFPNDNWDGWLDAICDLSWLPHRYVYVYHKALPHLCLEDLDFYVGALIHADSYWSSYEPFLNAKEYPDWASYGTKFFFDTAIKQEVLLMYERLKDKYSTCGNLPAGIISRLE